MTKTSFQTHRRRQQLRALAYRSLAVACLFFSAIVLMTWMLPGPSSDTTGKALLPTTVSGSQKVSPSASFRGRRSQSRIAIVLPFVGHDQQNIPSYLNVFCVGAAGAADIADFLIIHNGILRDQFFLPECPDNVKFISLQTTRAFAERLVRVLDHKDQGKLAFESLERLTLLVSKHIEVYPYSLVEFKPALGHIFQEYLAGYSHWGYSDVDMLFGDLGRWISQDELDDYDIVTYGFGDQRRLYLRGQFTFHKNNPKINQLWRGCDYLSDMDKRLGDVVRGKKEYHFESAEGCYSSAVLDHKDIRIKYAVKAWTDVDVKDTAYSHGLYLSRSPQSGKTILFKAASPETATSLLHLPSTWYKSDRVYSDKSLELQMTVGAIEEIALPDDANAKCMYWVQQKYQSKLCLPSSIQSDETLYYIDGKLHKQKHQNVKLQHDVVTGPFFHFQEWKRYYRPNQLTSLHLTSSVQTFVLSKEGVIPLSGGNEEIGDIKRLPSPLGVNPRKWTGVYRNDRTQLPLKPYCLISGPSKLQSHLPVPECYRTVSWYDREDVTILSGASQWRNVDVTSDITLVMTLQLSSGQANNSQTASDILGLAIENLVRWQGRPSVVLIYLSGANGEALDNLRRRISTSSGASSGIESSLIAVISQESDEPVSRKALLNMAIDVVPTRWYISGIELERGLIISPETVYFAHRKVQVRGDRSGGIYLIPQFALTKTGIDHHEMNLRGIIEANKRGHLKTPAEAEVTCDKDSTERLEKVNVLWLTQTEPMVDPELGIIGSLKKGQLIQELDLSILQCLTDRSHIRMFAMDESPIILVDNLSPHSGMRTDELVREVEELGGKRCYNGLKLAQLVAHGYIIDVLAGAFATSTQTSRHVVSMGIDDRLTGSSRCEGCFMFGEDHEDILEAIIEDEIGRPVKAAILLAEA